MLLSKDFMLELVKLSFEKHSQEEITEILNRDKPEEDKTNIKEVAKALKAGRQWLIREGEDAVKRQEEGIDAALGYELKQRFGLLDAIVVETPRVKTERQYGALLRKWGRAAGAYLDRMITTYEDMQEDFNVSVTGGETVLEIVLQLPERPRQHAHFYVSALIGRPLLQGQSYVSPDINTTLAWARSGRIPTHLHYGTIGALGLVKRDKKKMSEAEIQSEHLKCVGEIHKNTDKFSERETMVRFRQQMKKIDIAIASVGVVNPSNVTDGHSSKLTMTSLLQMHGVEPQLLQESGAVGEMNYNLFGADLKQRHHFFITPGYPDGLAFYQEMVQQKKPVLVAAGAFKEDVVRYGLNGKFFNVLVTDEHTASVLSYKYIE